MKYIPLLLALSLFFTGCNHRSDAEVRQNLPGAWHIDLASAAGVGTSTLTIATNGDFVCKTVFSNRNHTAEEAGTFQIADGFLVETITKATASDAAMSEGGAPSISKMRIIQADANKMVLSIDGTNEFVWQKDTR
jgi:hypothetical protein